jgi:hypothetical protein
MPSYSSLLSVSSLIMCGSGVVSNVVVGECYCQDVITKNVPRAHTHLHTHIHAHTHTRTRTHARTKNPLQLMNIIKYRQLSEVLKLFMYHSMIILVCTDTFHYFFLLAVA